MFFVYDYITARLKDRDSSNNYFKEEYEKAKSLLGNGEYREERLINIKKEYKENIINLKNCDLFKDMEYLFSSAKVKKDTVSNYYYAMKVYIEECKYPEFLTGESVIESSTENKTDDKK
jgi:hypothetical protein